MSQYKSPLVSCLTCREVKSAKGIFTHFIVSHIENGKDGVRLAQKKSTTSRMNNISTDIERAAALYKTKPKICPVCAKEHSFENRNHKFCSNRCRAKHNNKVRGKRKEETKNKIKSSVEKYRKENPKPKYTKIRQCDNCSNYYSLEIRPHSRNCSENCVHEIRSKRARQNPGLGTKRSKDEIRLYNLCIGHFVHVTSNEKIANGWDADILIYDTKTAILWNGPWHYKEMGLSNHSLKQVQNRDAIKTKEFQKIGWSVLVFEDRHHTPESAFKFLVHRVGNAPTPTDYESAVPL